MTRSRLFLCCLVLRGRANGNMRSNNFYIKTKTLINPRQITLLLNSVNHFSPHLASPEGEGQLLCFVKDWELQVTLVVDNLLIISHKSVCPSRALPHVPHAHIHNNTNNGISPSPSGEARWRLDGSMRSNNNFYIKTKTNIRSNLFFPFGKVRMRLRLGGG